MALVTLSSSVVDFDIVSVVPADDDGEGAETFTLVVSLTRMRERTSCSRQGKLSKIGSMSKGYTVFHQYFPPTLVVQLFSITNDRRYFALVAKSSLINCCVNTTFAFELRSIRL